MNEYCGRDTVAQMDTDRLALPEVPKLKTSFENTEVTVRGRRAPWRPGALELR